MGSKPSGISGSRAAGILAMSKWASPVDTWLKIMEEREPGFCKLRNYDTPQRVENNAIHWGLAFENEIIHLSAKDYGDFIPLPTREKEYIHDEYDFLTCHIDGMYSDGMLHEGKTTNSKSYFADWGTPGTDAIPAIYKIQVQHQMMLTNSEQAIVSALVFPKMQDEFGDLKPGEHTHWARALYEMGYFHQYTIDADPELHEMMLKIYKEFWYKNVLEKVEPDCMIYEDIRKIVRNPIGTIVADNDVFLLSQTYKQITKEMSMSKKQKDVLKTQILNYMKLNVEERGEKIDSDSREKWVLRDSTGRKLHQFNGKKFL